MKSKPTYIDRNGATKEANIYYQIRDLSYVDDVKLTMKHKVLLYVMETHGANAYPSRQTLAKECCCTIATIDKSLNDLIQMGLINKVRRRHKTNPKRFTSNRYQLNKDKIFMCLETDIRNQPKTNSEDSYEDETSFIIPKVDSI